MYIWKMVYLLFYFIFHSSLRQIAPYGCELFTPSQFKKKHVLAATFTYHYLLTKY